MPSEAHTSCKLFRVCLTVSSRFSFNYYMSLHHQTSDEFSTCRCVSPREENRALKHVHVLHYKKRHRGKSVEGSTSLHTFLRGRRICLKASMRCSKGLPSYCTVSYRCIKTFIPETRESHRKMIMVGSVAAQKL